MATEIGGNLYSEAKSADDFVSCKRGWVMFKSDDGTYLPFFIKVREDDIIWDWQLDDEIMNIAGWRPDSLDVFRPASFIMGMGGRSSDGQEWGVKFNSDLTCELNKKIYLFSSPFINGSYLTDADSEYTSGLFPREISSGYDFSVLTMKIDLPGNIKISNQRTDVFDIHITKEFSMDPSIGYPNAISSASLNWRPILNADGVSFSAIYIDLLSTFIDGFHDTENTTNAYAISDIYPQAINDRSFAIRLNIKGKLYSTDERVNKFSIYKK